MAYALLERAIYIDPPEMWKVVGTIELIIQYLREKAVEQGEQEEFARDLLDEIVSNLLYLRFEIVPTEDYIENQASLFRDMLDRANEQPKEEEE